MLFFKRITSVAVATLALASLDTSAYAADAASAVSTIKSTSPAKVPATIDDAQDEAVEFASLDAAVAAQDREVADEATRCLASAVYFESKGEPLPGQLAVAQVIINRAKSGRFPADVCGVVTQRGQFGFVRGGRIPSIDEERAAYRTAVAVARVALADAWDGAAETALYFNTPERAPAPRLRRVAMIGHHVFYR
ncbi:cell wall hydrolase [Sphingomonas rubra]|uniref:Cell Wall Hydrolase n=1 Tax=Sphingomonas rubra TaxID=634430 RepID=A0A1I5RCP5_9SPHN|nr:cell wall hydrolase [Sphingomonas rubra]SFP56328.1 Cell Wall Hydrolase [Sphingomonas rubra]